MNSISATARVDLTPMLYSFETGPGYIFERTIELTLIAIMG